ncbi:condensation domain-containing protein [Dactylosporangium sp. CS-033363]|uniref:condensation domain-containing protein n=1 Tax=Dactylosporangium sp. CS-033363 TaxID=3239935 RepID=UPI003D8E7747
MDIVVAFEGEGSGIAELTWGQRDVWDLMRRTGRTMNIGGTVPAAPGETVEHLAALLRFIVGRHQALRTRLVPTEGGPPRQEVHASGEIVLECVHAGPDAAVTAEVLRVRYQTAHFEPFAEWPVRMGVVLDGQTPTHVVLMYYHVLVDGFGIDAIVRDLANFDGQGDSGAPVQGVRPLELAAQQQEPAAIRQSEKALRHWERQLARIPAIAHRQPLDPGLGQPRHWEVVCESRALALAVRAIGARTGLASGPILLAAYANALARAAGTSTAAIQVVVSNRFRPGFAEAVTSLRQFGICVIEVAEPAEEAMPFDDVPARNRTAAPSDDVAAQAWRAVPFDDVAARAWAAMLGAFKHGYFDPAGLPAIAEPACVLNDRRRAVDDTDGQVPTAAEIRTARMDTSVRWGVREATYDATFYLHLEDEPGRIVYTLWGDTHRYAPEVIDRCARDLEAAVIDAALAPATVDA